jgi:integrase
MRGIRRCLGVQVERRAPLDLDDLDRCCVAADGSTFDQARARALLLTRARTAGTAGQLAKLTWLDVELVADEVVIDLPADHSSQRRRTVVVPRHDNPNLCLVTALTHLRRVAPRLDAVFSTVSGKAMDRTTVYRNLLRQARGRHWASLSGMTDRHLAPLLATPGLHTRLETARTRAVLLVGFWTAARRSNLAALNWRDVTDLGDDGWRVVWRRSKTDQEGQGFTIYLPQYADEADRASCPSHALRELLAAATEALGRPPRPDEPVFWRLTSGGTPELTLREARPTRMSGKSINLLVQRVVIDAGLTDKPKKGQKNPFGGHSLRMGFVTEALRDDKLNVGEVADVTGHRSYDVLMRYRNEINAAKNAPGKKLAQKMGRGA